MTTVAVRDNGTTHYVTVPSEDEDAARKVAFRYIFKRAELDYNELAHATYVLRVVTLSQDTANVMLTHVR